MNVQFHDGKVTMGKEVNTIEDFLDASFKLQEEIEAYNNGWEIIHHRGLAFRGQSNKYFELIWNIFFNSFHYFRQADKRKNYLSNI